MGFKTSSICPVLARCGWRPFTCRGSPATGTAVSESVCSTATPSCRSFFLDLSGLYAGLHSAQVTPSAAYACGSNSESARSFASSCNEGFSNMLRPHHADHSPALTLHNGRFLSLFLLVYCLIPSPKPSPVAAVSSLKLPIRYPHGQLFFTREDRSIRPLPLPYLPSSNLHLPLWPRL